MKEKVYPAKYDCWLWPILAASSIGLVIWGIAVWPGNQGEGVILVGVGLFDTLVFSLLVFPCRYLVGEKEVLIRCGILRYRIPIAEIRSVTRSSNPLAAPAPSLRRVAILLQNGKSYLVSPLDRDGFIRELRAALTEAT